jgi:hypothetical protein
VRKPSKGARVYTRTVSGHRAWASPTSGLPTQYRQIIGLIHHATSAESVCNAMQAHPARQVQAWLDELETLCFLEVKAHKGGHHVPPPEHQAA